MRILVFCGPKTAGKDAAAKYLLARNSITQEKLFEQMNFADPLKSAVQQVFGFTYAELHEMPFKEQVLDRWPYMIPRQVLQDVAKQFRTFYGGDVFARRWAERIKLASAQCVICTDLRHTEELDVVLEMGAKIVYVQNDRVEQEMKEKQAAGDPLWSDVSEALYDLLRIKADATITNNSSLEALHSAADDVSRRLLGDWSSWGLVNPVIKPDLRTTLAQAPG